MAKCFTQEQLFIFKKHYMQLCRHAKSLHHLEDDKIAKKFSNSFENLVLKRLKGWRRCDFWKGLTIEAEQANLVKLNAQKEAAEEDIRASEEAIESRKSDLSSLQETLDEKSKAVDLAKKTASKASKLLDQTLKEIAICVRCSSKYFPGVY